MIRRLVAPALLLSCTAGLSGCSWFDRSDDAAREAALAAATLQAGALGPARRHILAALAIRDDVSEYWQLRAQIATAQGRGQEAYDAYRTLIALDRGNADALRALCQLGSQYGRPAELDRFADQLAVLAPDDPLAITAHGSAALMRGNDAAADRYAEQALAASPNDPGALILKSQVLRRARRFDEAAALIRRTSGMVGASPAMLEALTQIYRQARNRPGYVQAIAQLAATDPKNVDAALELADLRYQDGDAAAARAVVATLVRRHPDDVALAGRLLALWLDRPDALTPAQIAADAAGASLQMRAAYAQYAVERGLPDLALALVGAVRGRGFSPGTLDAQVALAEAIARKGNGAEARRIVDAALAVDANHPRALVARARLAWAGGDRNAAVSDLRQVLADDDTNATARILLSDYLTRSGEATLALATLRDGMTAAPGSPRIAEALVRMLAARGRARDGAAVLNDLAIAAPLDLDAQRLRTRLCPATGNDACRGPVKFATL